MKLIKIIVSLFMIFSLNACSSSNQDNVPRPSSCGNLQVVDGKLSDEKGNPIQLKGVSTHSLCRSEKFINQECFDEISKDWKVNVVRLAMYTYGMDSYNHSDYFHEKNLELIDKGVEYATKSDMYTIIDWHILSDGNPFVYKEEAMEFFESMSSLYASNNNVIYEICNEPNGEDVTWDVIKEYANTIIPIIRKNDPNSVILVGSPDWSQRIDLALENPLEFDNIMYSYHFYAASHKDDLRNRLKEVSEKNLPVFVTEYGITSSSGGFPRDIESSEEWMNLLDEYNISSCMWSFSRTGEACSIFGDGKKYSGFDDSDLTETGIWLKDMLKKTYEKE